MTTILIDGKKSVLIESHKLEEIRKILNKFYSLKDGDFVVPNQPAVSSQVFFWHDKNGQRLVVKESRWYDQFVPNPKEVLEEIYRVATKLKERGVSLQTAVKNFKGNFVTEQNGQNIVVLEYQEGQSFSGKLEEWAAAGQALAEWHKAGANFARTVSVPVEKPYEESRNLYLDGFREQLLKEHECSISEVCRAVKNNIQRLDEIMEFIDTTFTETPSQIITLLHNDFNTENGLYHMDGSFAAFLDIDQLSTGPAVWDIGNSLLSFLSKENKKLSGQQRQLLTEHFLVAYHRHFPLPTEEYLLIMAAVLRWDVMRILRSLRRHHFENNRFPELTQKIKDRLLGRLTATPELLGFINRSWLEKILR